jgi:hypothetical protein
MRKRIIDKERDEMPAPQGGWLDLEALASVELTSESGSHPIETALRPHGGPGWQAAEPGEQRIRLIFDEPVRLHRIHLEFDERVRERTQEFVLRWSSDEQAEGSEIVRQQYTFSPGGANREIEDYLVELSDVAVLELEIIPDISGGVARATLARMQLA